MEWQIAGNKWLCAISAKLFSDWRKNTPAGRRYKNGANPYKSGFFLPDYFDRAIQALNNDDEETFKAIKMVEGQYMAQHKGYVTYLNTPLKQ